MTLEAILLCYLLTIGLLMPNTWSLWVGGSEVNDTYLLFYEAYALGMQYRDYDDVFIRNEVTNG